MFEQMLFSEKYPVFRKLAEIGDLRKLTREELLIIRQKHHAKRENCIRHKLSCHVTICT